MSCAHRELAAGRWNGLAFVEQMANVGGEVERMLNWRVKGNAEYGQRAFERALELFDLTMGDPKNKARLKEVARAREVLADFALGENTHLSDDASWRRYFAPFAHASRRHL
jgi:hypothetical protein